MFKTHRKLFISLFIILTGGVLFITAGILHDKTKSKVDLQQVAYEFRESFLQNKERAQNSLDLLIDKKKINENNEITDFEIFEIFAEKYDKYGFSFMVSDKENLIFWSNNSPAYSRIKSIQSDQCLLELHNGYYYLIRQSRDNYDFRVLMLLKSNYNYQNKFLRNTYHDTYDISLESVSPTLERTNLSIFDKQEENVLFYLCPGDQSEVLIKSKPYFYSANIISVLSLILIFYGLYYLVFVSLNYKINDFAKVLLFILLVAAARILFYFVGVAAPLAESDLFSPALYATSYYLPTLGDLFFNVILILWLTWVVYNKIQNKNIKQIQALWQKSLVGFIATVITGFAGYLAYYIIEGLVINSRLNLNVNFMLSLDSYSIIGFLIIASILFSFYFFAGAIFTYLNSLIKPKKQIYAVVIPSFVIFFIVVNLLNFSYPILLAVLVLIISFLVINEKREENKLLNYRNLMISIFVFSIITTAALYRFNQVKEQDERESLALKLSSEQDPIAEYLFLEIEKDLVTDSELHSIVLQDPYNEHVINNYLTYNYFYDYWHNYDMQVTVCYPDELLLIKPENIEEECGYFFSSYINYFGKSTMSDYLFYLDNNTGRDSYIARIPVFNDDELLSLYPEETPDYYINIEFDSRYIPRDIGFPELLADESIDTKKDLLNYSVAFYKYGELTHRSGKYFFHNNLSAYGDFEKEFEFFETGNYNHLNYQKDKDTNILISREKDGIFEIIAPFSYLFVMFFLMLVILWLFLNIHKVNRSSFKLNFKRRVQFSMVVIVILSVLSIGWVSVWFLFDIHEDKSHNTISEKAHSVLLELENDLGGEQYLDYTYSSYLSDRLMNLSKVFFTDINLFDPHGKLLASSRSRVFEEGLVSGFMNPEAFLKMKDRSKSFFVHNEQIGKMEYLSAYVPLKNQNNQLLAYINLPYFARESELQYEASTFLVTFININLLLLVMAVVFAFFISNYVTRPLQLIRESLSKLQLGKTNRKISWYRNDEIGSLVREYNRMIDELEVSAGLLAKNERESAWREMAKQVAHEIKNPLTPMKLSVQYLHKAWKNRSEDWEARLEGFTKTMVEQIDSLSLIATEFSDFAKLPGNNNSRVVLNNFVSEALELYKDFDHIEINLHIDKDKMVVHADSKQLLRIFNNLINNAIQSYKKDEFVHLEIECTKEGDEAVIKFKDKGCGIAESKKDKIFDPYFTTKTGGLGLGLAMVKKIIEGFDGTITFESQLNSGSTFIVRLPLIE